MEVSRKVEKKWAAFVPNKTKQNIWSKQAMLHWTHCYITRVLHQRPLIHWANLTLALRSQSTQREQFICAFKCWVWSEPNQIFFARWDLYTCCCWLYNTSEREQVPQRPLPTPVAHSYCNNQAAACWAGTNTTEPNCAFPGGVTWDWLQNKVGAHTCSNDQYNCNKKHFYSLHKTSFGLNGSLLFQSIP